MTNANLSPAQPRSRYPAASRLGLCLVVSTLSMGAAAGAESRLSRFEQEVQVVCQRVANAAEQRPVRVEPFVDRSPGAYSGKAGEGLRQVFVTHLRESGATMNDGADLILSARFAIRDRPSRTDGREPLIEMTLQPELEDAATGQQINLLPVEADVTDEAFLIRTTSTSLIARQAGVTGAVPSDRDAEGGVQVPKRVRHAGLRTAVADPSAAVRANRVLPSASSPYAVEILAYDTRRDASGRVETIGSARSLMPTLENGRPMVDIPLDKVYELRLYNNTDKPVAADLSIDGLGVFHFAEEAFRHSDTGLPRFRYYIVMPRGARRDDGSRADGTATIQGWFRRVSPPDNVLSFLTTTYGQGAASSQGIPATGPVGSIHVQFAHCRRIQPGSRARGGRETGFGPPRSVNLKPVPFEVDPPHEFVTIRYTR